MLNHSDESPIVLPNGPLALIRRVGVGGSSQVWAVERNAQPFALKIGNSSATRFIASEAESLTLACSSHLPSVVEAGRLPSSGLRDPSWHQAPYLLLTWTAGETLSATLQPDLDALEKSELALAVARDVGRALADLHEAGVAHGDVKPENILVARVGDSAKGEYRCSLIDLGLAGQADAQQLRGATPRYLPPEYRKPQRDAHSATDASSRDLWALGLTLLEVFEPAKDISELDTSCLPAAIKPVVAALLAPTASARPRARWVAQQTGYRNNPEHQHLAIRRKYLAAQRPFLKQVAEGSAYKVEVAGFPGSWLTDACRVLACIPYINGVKGHSTSFNPLCAQSLAPEQQRHFVVELCGLASIDLPPLPPQQDDVLIAQLLKATTEHPLEALSVGELASLIVEAPRLEKTQTIAISSDGTTPADIAPSERSSGYGPEHDDGISQADLALELGAERPGERILQLAERAVFSGAASLPFALRLGRALKRLGELGRARAVLLTRSEPEAALEMAAVLARSGAPDEALTRARELLQDRLSRECRASAASLVARLHLARGDSDSAAHVLEGQVATAECLEAEASVALVRAELDRARSLLARARGLARQPEQQARIESLDAHLHHQVGDHNRALKGYQRAAEHAARAGALLEEATYLVGLASSAAHLALSDDALRAAQRAEALFEFLHNPAASARAALSRASTLGLLGAQVESASAARVSVQRAKAARDCRCEAFARLLLSEVQSEDSVAQIDRAEALLQPVTRSDKLRLGAARARNKVLPASEWSAYDALADTELDIEVRLEWWAARANAILTPHGPLGETSHSTDKVLDALASLANSAAPVEAAGRAFAAGAELAARAGDGERCLRFLSVAKSAHDRIVGGAPQSLKLTARQLPWATWANRQSSESPLRGEQIVEVERLVRSLADRSRLRPILDRTLDALVRWTGVERGLLLLKAPEGRLVPRAARNLARHDLSREQLELSHTLAQRALETGDCVVAVDATGELSTVHHSVHALRLRSVLAVPLTAHGDTLGVVYLDDRVRRGAFGDAELAWVRLVASIASVAIADARDQTLLRRAVRRAQRAEQRMVDHLSKTQTELSQVKAVLESQTAQVDRHPTLVGSSAGMRSLKQLIDRVAASDVPVLISGESGTGKELVARAIHRSGARKDKAFVSENCSAIPETLLESTLFGHQKGAFTGATHSHVGLFEMSHGGTLFLDELGEMSLSMQAKLLRVLETGELRRIGGEKTVRVDVRVLGASHKELSHLVEQGVFREDLYYRLNVVTVRVPPLRERAEDVADLVSHFLVKHDKTGNVIVTPGALSVLQLFAWPGNVRQLENEIRRAIVLCDGRITPEHLSPPINGHVTATPVPETQLNLRQHVDALEVRLIERALHDTQGNQTRAAEVLGISRFGLQKMLKRLSIALPQ